MPRASSSLPPSDPQGQIRLRRARRTAKIVAAVAFGIFVFSIVQVLWLRHEGYHAPPPTMFDGG